MDRYDPNEWTQRFVTREPDFCLSVICQTTEQVIQLVKMRQYTPAISGLDRILNGLITFQNAGADFRPYICMFSWIEATIIALGANAPEENRRRTAISLYEDARDFATSENTKQNITSIIRILNSGRPLLSLKDDIEPDFPYSVEEILEDLLNRLSS